MLTIAAFITFVFSDDTCIFASKSVSYAKGTWTEQNAEFIQSKGHIFVKMYIWRVLGMIHLNCMIHVRIMYHLYLIPSCCQYLFWNSTCKSTKRAVLW